MPKKVADLQTRDVEEAFHLRVVELLGRRTDVPTFSVAEVIELLGVEADSRKLVIELLAERDGDGDLQAFSVDEIGESLIGQIELPLLRRATEGLRRVWVILLLDGLRADDRIEVALDVGHVEHYYLRHLLH